MYKGSKNIHLFNERISGAKVFFDEKVNNSTSAKFFREYFGFETSPDLSSNNDTTYFELYWKDRLIDISNNGEQKEYGAKLKLGCSSRGYVNVVIYPCNTQDWKCKEDCIVLSHRLKPDWLGNKLFLQYLWWSFISYSSVTAIDSSPSILSRIHVGLMRYFCSKRIDGVLEGVRFWHDFKILIGVIFAIVSSDLFVYYLPDRSNIDEAQRLEERISCQNKQIDSLLMVVEQQNDKLLKEDSLQYYLELIERNTKLIEKNTKRTKSK